MKIKKLSILTFAAVFAFVSIATSMVSLADVKAEEVPAKENKKVATDITGHWMANTLADFNTKGYLVGDENGRVFPDRNMSRAEYAAVINRMMQFTEESGEISKYTDVKSGDWYRADMAKALQAGYIKGTGADTLSPNSTVTREQAFVMLYRLSYPNGVKDQKQAKLTDFSDAGQISEYAKEAISVLVAAGVIQGEFGRLNPKKDITRAQAVLILSKSEKQLAVAMKDLNEQEFVGTGAGYGGTMRVKVVFNKGKITDIKIVSSNETSSYLVRAEKIIAQIIAKQSVEGIDNVSGATLSCNAIKDAVKDCISQQKGLGKIGTVGMTGSGGKSKTTLHEGEDLSEYLKTLANGDYEGAAQGYRDLIHVKVTVKDKKIEKVEILSHKDDLSYFESAKKILDKFKGKNSTKEIDAVSNATFSRNGIVKAVENAIVGANLGVLKNPGVLSMEASGDIKINGSKNPVLLKKLVENVEEVSVKARTTAVGGRRIRKAPVAKRMPNGGIIVAGNEAKERVFTGNEAQNIINPETGKINFAAKDREGKYIFDFNTTYDINVKVGKNISKFEFNLAGYKTITKDQMGDFKDGTYYGEGYGFSKAERQSKNGDKGFDFPKKNIAKLVIARGEVADAALEFFVDDDDDWKYNGGSERLVKYVKATPLNTIYEKFTEKKGLVSLIDGISGSTMSAEGFRKGFVRALEDAKVGKQQKYKGFWLIKAPGKLEKHELTDEEKQKRNKLKTDDERRKFDADHEFESVPQYFGEKIELVPASVRLIPVNAPLPNPVTRFNRDAVLKLGKEIEAKDFDKEGIEVFVTDKQGNKIKVEDPIVRQSADADKRANYLIHWKHKESGLEILKEVQFSIKPVYVPIEKIRLVLKSKKASHEITYQDIAVKTGKDKEFRYEVGIDLAHNEIQDIELIKKDGSKVQLKEEGDKHYQGNAHQKNGTLYVNIAQEEKDKLKQENAANLNEEKIFEFVTYRIDYKKDFTNVTDEEQKKIIGIDYTAGIKNKIKVGDKFEIGDDFAVKLIAENEDKYSENVNKLNYTNYLTITKNGSPLNIGDVITDDPSDAGKQVKLKIAYKEDDSVFYEHNVMIESAITANNVPDYLEITHKKEGASADVTVRIKLEKGKATYKFSSEDISKLGALGKIQKEKIKFYNSNNEDITDKVGIRKFIINNSQVAILATADSEIYRYIGGSMIAIRP